MEFAGAMRVVQMAEELRRFQAVDRVENSLGGSAVNPLKKGEFAVGSERRTSSTCQRNLMTVRMPSVGHPTGCTIAELGVCVAEERVKFGAGCMFAMPS
jgi:hypothetical protein